MILNKNEISKFFPKKKLLDLSSLLLQQSDGFSMALFILAQQSFERDALLPGLQPYTGTYPGMRRHHGMSLQTMRLCHQLYSPHCQSYEQNQMV